MRRTIICRRVCEILHHMGRGGNQGRGRKRVESLLLIKACSPPLLSLIANKRLLFHIGDGRDLDLESQANDLVQ